MSRAVADNYRQWCPMCLDFHAHFVHPAVFAACVPHSVGSGFGRVPLSLDNPVYRSMMDPEIQIADMDRRGIDMTVISSNDVVLARSWADPDEEAMLAGLINDMAAGWAARYPTRFIGTFTLPLGDPKAMLREFGRARSMGLRIAHLATNYRGTYLGDRRFDDMWAAFREGGIVTFIHPDGVRDPWFQDFSLWNSIGQSIEEVKVMSSLIYEGVLDRHPGLRIVMAHGGGYMPHYMGRLDRNVRHKPDTMKNMSKKPSEYLTDFYYDSCVYDPRTLEALIARVGPERVLMGGDYPFADIDPVDFLATVGGLEDSQRAAIAGSNGAALLGL